MAEVTPVNTRRIRMEGDVGMLNGLPNISIPGGQQQRRMMPPTSPPMITEEERYAEYVLSDEDVLQWNDVDDDEDEEEDEDEVDVEKVEVEEEGIEHIDRIDDAQDVAEYCVGRSEDEDDDLADDADDESETRRTKNFFSKDGNNIRRVVDKHLRDRHHRSASGGRPIFRYIRNLAVGRSSLRNSHSESGEDGDLEDTEGLGDVMDAAQKEDLEGDDETSLAEDDDDDGIEGSYSWEEDLIESDDEGGQEYYVDWEAMPVLPNSFFSQSNDFTSMPSSPPALRYLDAGMWHTQLTKADGNYFVWEHALLLQAVLQLLAEREQVGVEGSVDAADNIWKKGPLKKMSFAVGRSKMRPTAGAWLTKYVELRRGNLCYYEDSDIHDRKMIHLRQHEAVVQESSQHGPGFVFELLIEGDPARYWAARSDEERQAWVEAIQAAMIGEENRRPRKLDLSPYMASIKLYKEIRDSIHDANVQEYYFEAIHKAILGGESLQIPVQWIREELNGLTGSPLGDKRLLAPKKFVSAHQRLKCSISEFWRWMRKLSFSINGFVIPRDSPVASERVVGSLTRCILEFDKATEESTDSSPKNAITELQAVSYARSILLSVLQGKEHADTQKVVDDLLRGRPDLVKVSCLSEEYDIGELTRLEVSFAGDELPDDFDEPGSEDISNWIALARRKNGNSSVPNSKWKRRFAVLSGAVLSFYEAADPRPHGLRGQLVLRAEYSIDTEELPKESKADPSLTMDRKYVVIIKTPADERLLCFDEKSDMMAWKETLQKALDVCLEAAANQREAPVRTPATKMLAKAADRVIKVAADGSIRGGISIIKATKDSGMKAMKIATDGSMKAMRFATDGSMKVFRGAVGRLRNSSGTPRGPEVGNRRRPSMTRIPSVQALMKQSKGPEKRDPTVQCVVQRARTFSLRAVTDRDRDETDDSNYDFPEDDHWLTVQVTWYQAFLMYGGPSGRINSGDALVVVDFLMSKDDYDDEWVGEPEAPDAPEQPLNWTTL